MCRALFEFWLRMTMKRLRMVGAVFWKPVQAGVCGQAVDGRDAVEKAIELNPDVALVDVSMPHVNGFEVARCIHERMPDSRILLVREQDPRFIALLSPQPGVSGVRCRVKKYP
jgi:DNA-binding NarL/FixJ family response regulator